MTRALIALLLALGSAHTAFAQSASTTANPPLYPAGSNALSQTLSGGLRVQPMMGANAVSSTNPLPTATTAGTRTLVPLTVATVTTGGTAVTALTAGQRSAGGFIQNPPSATINLCINEIGTASGTTSAGNTTCVVPGQSYNLAPSANAVSVISSDSAHPFSGLGYQ